MDFANIQSNSNLVQYLPVVLFLIIGAVLIGTILAVSYFVAPQNPNFNKLQPYECGFDAFEDTRRQFDIRFYLVAILFIIFDLEIIFMYPWAVSLGILDNYGFYSMLVFVFILVIGFIYEWKKGALNWE